MKNAQQSQATSLAVPPSLMNLSFSDFLLKFALPTTLFLWASSPGLTATKPDVLHLGLGHPQAASVYKI